MKNKGVSLPSARSVAGPKIEELTCASADVPNIVTRLRLMDEAITQLKDSVEKLDQKIQPLITPYPRPNTGEPNLDKPIMGSSMGAQIEVYNTRINAITEFIETLTCHIDL